MQATQLRIVRRLPISRFLSTPLSVFCLRRTRARACVRSVGATRVVVVAVVSTALHCVVLCVCGAKHRIYNRTDAHNFATERSQRAHPTTALQYSRWCFAFARSRFASSSPSCVCHRRRAFLPQLTLAAVTKSLARHTHTHTTCTTSSQLQAILNSGEQEPAHSARHHRAQPAATKQPPAATYTNTDSRCVCVVYLRLRWRR